MFWTVTLPLDVTVAVLVPSLIVIVLPFATANDEGPVKLPTLPMTLLVKSGFTEKFAGLISSDPGIALLADVVDGDVGRFAAYWIVVVAFAGRKLF